jgi:hypothetical protein
MSGASSPAQVLLTFTIQHKNAKQIVLSGDQVRPRIPIDPAQDHV